MLHDIQLHISGCVLNNKIIEFLVFA